MLRKQSGPLNVTVKWQKRRKIAGAWGKRNGRVHGNVTGRPVNKRCREESAHRWSFVPAEKNQAGQRSQKLLRRWPDRGAAKNTNSSIISWTKTVSVWGSNLERALSKMKGRRPAPIERGQLTSRRMNRAVWTCFIHFKILALSPYQRTILALSKYRLRGTDSAQPAD